MKMAEMVPQSHGPERRRLEQEVPHGITWVVLEGEKSERKTSEAVQSFTYITAALGNHR